MKIITPQSAINVLKERMAKLKAEGKEATVNNLNAEFFKEFKKKVKEESNG